MGIKSKIEDKAQETTDTLQFQAQARFIKWLMKEEDVDQETAWAIVEGRTDPPEYDYMLGFKLANPVLQLALFSQISKEKRKQAAENFAATLSDPERELFYSEVFDEKNAKKFKDVMKKEKKKARRGKHEV